MILTILAFLFVLGVLVLVHEFGHFIAAKKAGVKVEEFAFGFPPRLFSAKRGETRYSINAIPFGGYVKMLGELEHSNHPRAFENQSTLKRFVISIAGVVMNILLAWVILTVGFAVGMSPIVSNPNAIPGQKLSSEIIVADVQADSPASKAGLEQGDVLLGATVSGQNIPFDEAGDVGALTKSHRGEKVVFQYERLDKTAEREVQLSDSQDAPLGVAVAERSIVRVPWYRAPYVALHETWKVVEATFSMLKNFVSDLFSTGKVADEVGGPVAVYVYSGLAARAGLMVFMQFIAMLSINLALINILPFPALDGGRLLFIALEGIRGKKVVREELENIIHTIGFVLLIILLVAITYRDIIKLF
ncbi:MAG: site-2 protease family protein [Patescibacteria group bacterium]|jgi:regulator of sigma E protease